MYSEEIQKVLRKKKGICIESALLMTLMLKIAGLRSEIAIVYKDFTGERVKHACSAVWLNNRWVLLDVAYNMFDVKHKEYELIKLSELLTSLKSEVLK